MVGIARCNKDLVNNTYEITPSFQKFLIESFPVARKNDIVTGTSDFVNTVSTKFFVNGFGVARINDITIQNEVITSGSTKFFTN